MHNIDFTAADLDSGAKWLRAAATENYDYNLGMRQISDTMAEMRGVGAGGGDNLIAISCLTFPVCRETMMRKA